ncbi:hypothetical protein SUFG_00010 [Sulfitobacter phage phiCB2047-B]|uniref:Uncharacterized protein n=1 Tax=Sulfitobacter phage phiCB2047-B TaxID=754046 RepID=M4PMX3_9CAUD|nr:hypothetical protein SUFG_00010 [Sulfitobacter phage phiCB2047-B]AGH07383.1 hypothetical protein SUFG_00010 [Sulfitobacter phage phiCB2047-B]
MSFSTKGKTMDLYNASNNFEDDEQEQVLTVAEYEEQKESLQLIISRGKLARTLASNPEFKQLISEGYLTQEPQRIAELMASGRLHKNNMENCMAELDAIGKFRSFLRLNLEQASAAESELASLEEARDESIRLEEEELAKQN